MPPFATTRFDGTCSASVSRSIALRERPPDLDVRHPRVGVAEREEARPARGAEVRVVGDARARGRPSSACSAR